MDIFNREIPKLCKKTLNEAAFRVRYDPTDSETLISQSPIYLWDVTGLKVVGD